MAKKVIIYSKWCVQCEYPEEIKLIRMCFEKIKVRRTTYRPDWHRKAARLNGNDNYDVLVVYKGQVKNIMDFANYCRNKLVKEGRLKNDMLNMQRTEDVNREDGQEAKGTETKTEDEKRKG